MKKSIFILLHILFFYACSKDSPATGIACMNCPDEICEAVSEGVIQITTADSNHDFYSKCIDSRFELDNRTIDIFDLGFNGTESFDASFYALKNDGISWQDLEGKTYTFENYEEVNSNMDILLPALRWSVDNPNDIDSPIRWSLDSKENSTFRFSTISGTSTGSIIKVICSGTAHNFELGTLEVTNAEINVTIK